MRPHWWQPTRLPHPWDSPGKSTGVGCHFLLQCILKEGEGEVSQSCLTLCDPVDCNLLGFSIHRVLQARILKWIAISFSRGSSQPGIEPGSPALQADALPSEPLGKPTAFTTLEKEMATHSSALAWRIPGMEEPCRLLSMGSHRVGHDWSNLAAAAALCYIISMSAIIIWLSQ